MEKTPAPDDSGRLAALQQYGILNTAPEKEFDDLARLAASICGTPIGCITLMDRDRQWFKARQGLDIAQTPRSDAFCNYTIREPGVMVSGTPGGIRAFPLVC
jgi:GAF domain-containing protein